MDPATGFEIDPVTGWLVHPLTGYVIEPGTNRLVIPGSLAYTTFRWDPETGLVEEDEEDEEPTPSAEPSESASASPTATPSPSAEPTSKPSATPKATSSAEAVDVDTDQAGNREPIGTHPVTRIAVVALLVGLGALYYTRLRPGSKGLK